MLLADNEVHFASKIPIATDEFSRAEQAVAEALVSISIVTHVVLYFYAVNVFKNLKRMFPGSQWIAFCYWLISFEFVKKVPFLESFLKQRKEVSNGKN